MVRAIELSKGYRVAILCIMLLGFGLRVVDLDRMPPFAHGDDANLAEYSLRVVSGDVPLYGIRPDGDPNFAFALFAPYTWFGSNLYSLRVVAAMWSMLGLASVFFAARQVFGPRAATFATLLLAASHLFIHFGRIATIVVPSVVTSFAAIGLLYAARRHVGKRRAVLFFVAGAMLSVNLYEYAAAKAVFFSIMAMWLLALPRKKAGWRQFAADAAPYAIAVMLVAAPVAGWYAQRPADLLDRMGFLSVFHPRNAVVNLRLYGPTDTTTLILNQILRSVGAFLVTSDTSPNYHFDSALLDPATAVLFLGGLGVALFRKPKVAGILLVWAVAGLIAGAILLVEPPTSYHYIVLVPLACVFGGVLLERLAASSLAWRLAPALIAIVVVANVHLYFDIYPTKGAWYSLESDVGFYISAQRHCCAYWYLGDPEPTPRKITALIATPEVIHYVRDEEELIRVMSPYLVDDQPQIVIVPNDKIPVMLPRLQARFPGGREYHFSDRGRRMFCAYRIGGRVGRQQPESLLRND